MRLNTILFISIAAFEGCSKDIVINLFQRLITDHLEGLHMMELAIASYSPLLGDTRHGMECFMSQPPWVLEKRGGLIFTDSGHMAEHS